MSAQRRWALRTRTWQGAGLLACLAAGACVSRSAAPPVPSPDDPAAVLRTVREREERITSMRAMFTAETDVDGRRRTADGVLLLRKPDLFRLRLFLPFGVTLLDYLGRGDSVSIVMPLRRGGPPPADLAPFSRDDVGAAFLRGAEAFPGVCRIAPGGNVHVVLCEDGTSGALLRRIRIDPMHGTILDEVSYGGSGEARTILSFGDYRPVESAFLPYRVRMTYPGRSLSVVITIDRYEVNPELPDALFAPLPS